MGSKNKASVFHSKSYNIYFYIILKTWLTVLLGVANTITCMFFGVKLLECETCIYFNQLDKINWKFHQIITIVQNHLHLCTAIFGNSCATMRNDVMLCRMQVHHRAHTQAHSDITCNLDTNYLNCMSLDCGDGMRFLGGNPHGMGRTCKCHAHKVPSFGGVRHQYKTVSHHADYNNRTTLKINFYSEYC